MDRNKQSTYIFDVDGTLYSQTRMRLGMLGRLLLFYGLRPHRLREFCALYLFRKLREKSEWKRASFDALYRELGKRLSLPPERIERCVSRWMFEAPLELLPKCAYRDVVSFANAEHRAGKRIIVYSDYPAEEKLAALGMERDAVYAFGENGVEELKPSPAAMRRILSESGCAPEEILYVGDRDDRDRPSAEAVGIPYRDVRRFRRELIK